MTCRLSMCNGYLGRMSGWGKGDGEYDDGPPNGLFREARTVHRIWCKVTLDDLMTRRVSGRARDMSSKAHQHNARERRICVAFSGSHTTSVC